jgi:CRP-like cAMP-binding protein
MRKVLFILGQLSDDDVEWIAAHGNRKIVSTGDIIITMGKQTEAIYFLLDGEVSVTVRDFEEIARLKCGEILGEMSLVDASPPSATVTAVTECLLLEIPKSLLNAKMASDIYFAAHFYRAIATYLSDRIRKMTVKKTGDETLYLDGEDGLEDELDANVLDNVHLAGARFERMLKKMMGNG